MLLIYGIQGIEIEWSISEKDTDYEKIIREEKCVLFIKKFCPFSIKARELLYNKGISCKIIPVDGRIKPYNFAKTYQSTFPVFFFNGTFIEGGYQKLKDLSIHKLPPFDQSPLFTEGSYEASFRSKIK
ncbi:glutaredoxin-like protein [Encephalitozoon intestinalis ATCC 50506]|uniref:Glutaredoxin-like protein n=1 Tax=Encephalitozoon intestinalis (strain ATCC 50506) TaxID=876142 RepID=E0S8D0_ENCIT|nr:glutaredoxin-like protein [Encephalitozoon intestinalis ATCC 50506]ADM12068.1 glutaredoxin-like protein [Encephalitozoon intestinalis ATCC 50506]UTX45858.1 glutaredoxin-2 [Encephalitozoon intestinalis]